MVPGPHRTTFSLGYPKEDRARIVARSLSLEIGEIDDDRSHTEVYRDGCVVHVEVGAKDLVALRAAMNSWLSLASVAERACETVDF